MIDEVMQFVHDGNNVPARPSLPSKLFVGSLIDSTTSATLCAHFEPFGPIVDAVVSTDRDSGRTRNFGFATMLDRTNAPRTAAALHRSELDGSSVVVNVETERT